MKIKKLLFVIVVSNFLFSCGIVKEGFKSPKQNKSDEFLVEKKTPLRMPPNFNELPKPLDKIEDKVEEDTVIKDLIKNNEKKKVSSDSNSDLESLVLEKIKDN